MKDFPDAMRGCTGRVSCATVVESPREILTRALTSDGKPLFSNAQELARVIAQIPPHPNESAAVALLGDPSRTSNRYYNRPKQAGVFLNIVLSGVRPCPESLRRLIAESIRRRMGNGRLDEAEAWISKLETSFAEREAQEKEERSADTHEKVALRLLNETTDVLIARAAPHDEFELLSDPVMRGCLERLGILGTVESEGSDDLPQVTLCLSNETVARQEAQFLVKWIRNRASKLGESEQDAAEAQLRHVIAVGMFRVVAMQNAPTVIPFIIFGVNDPDDARGFCFTVSRHGKAGFLQLPQKSCFELQIAFLGELRSDPKNHLHDAI